MSDKIEELAIISEVGLGMRDASFPILWFNVEGLFGGSLQVIPWDIAYDVIKENGIRDTKDLNGKACVVEISDNTVKFKRMFK